MTLPPDLPRVSFGIIVLNGEPFTRYCLRALYPFAYEIIVVEGAAPAAAGVATDDGHSRDGTLRALRTFQAYEDPDERVKLVTAEDEGHASGFWPGEKHEQSQAYARRATGDYLWQVDIDEFYQPEDMRSIIELLHRDSAITAVSFKQMTFWGGFRYWTDSWYLRRGLPQIHRVFQWRPGHSYATHRPPTVLDNLGNDLRRGKWIDGYQLERRGIRLYHYSLVFPSQVGAKSEYYAKADWAHRHRALDWATESYCRLRRPYRVHNVYDYPSWLEHFRGVHPPAIAQLQRDLAAGRLDVELRPTADIERLLASPTYRLGRWWLKRLSPLAVLVELYLLWRARLASFWRDPRRALRRAGQRLRGEALK
jgi:hypothetical protein